MRYGDRMPGFRGKEFVPALIYQKGCDLGSMHRNPEGVESLGQELTLLDLADYVRKSIAFSGQRENSP